MYFPFMRGKQYELAALRDIACRLRVDKVVPIIEPVKVNIKPLCSTAQDLNNVGVCPHIIVNPEVGELASDSPDYLFNLIKQENICFTPCVRLHSQNISHVQSLLNNFISNEISFSLYLQEDIQSNIGQYTSQALNNIILNQSSYSHQFTNSLPNCVIISSAFPAKNRNADYSIQPQFFSDAHLTYQTLSIQGQVGFGDCLTIDNTWSTSGGPAFVIALHITYIDNSNLNMYVKHSLSTSNPNDQSNPAGKFREALDAMIQFANQTPSLNQNTLGFQEYINIYNTNHYPGLGIPKKLSMMHHIETINNYL